MYKVISLYDWKEIPEDCVIVNMYPDWMSTSLSVMIRHPSFDVVPDGERVPEFVSWEEDKDKVWRVVPNPQFILEEQK